MNPKATKMWAIHGKEGFYVNTFYTRKEAIRVHTEALGKTWRQCRSSGDRVIKVMLTPLGSWDLQHIKDLSSKYIQALEENDMKKANIIFDVIINLVKLNDVLPTIQDYFKGEKISEYKNTIHKDKALEYVVYLAEKSKEIQGFK